MFQLLAVCPMGLEAVVAREIQELGYETNVENGRIFFEGDASAIVKANLWLRTADRIKIVVGRFNATTLTNYSNKPKRSLGNLLLIKKVTSQFKVEALNQHYIVCQIVRR
ncbi:N6-adenine-specific DNA methylase [Staphylococcus aureus]|uniref:N6-adenine-specific DNA methylase n=1 Tax=Staphylococcus aureus TaxID=1280 RepID=A0A380E3S0_STAAU|nr:N6-adenine-specific DNA methylase [Staphylococcus aureus]